MSDLCFVSVFSAFFFVLLFPNVRASADMSRANGTPITLACPALAVRRVANANSVKNGRLGNGQHFACTQCTGDCTKVCRVLMETQVFF